MFQFRRFPTYGYLIYHTLTVSSTAGFPHSEIHGSLAAFASPWLIVDRYVLRRLLVPRHSPYALSSLTMLDRINPSSNHLVHLWVFPSTIIYCSFTQYFTISHLLALCSVFKVHLRTLLRPQGNFELVCDFSLAALCFCMRKSENRKTTEIWWAQVDSNHRPHAYQACALTC